MLPGGAPESDVAGESSPVNAEGPADGIKALDEPPAVHQDTEAVAHAPALKETSEGEEKPGETLLPAALATGSPCLTGTNGLRTRLPRS